MLYFSNYCTAGSSLLSFNGFVCRAGTGFGLGLVFSLLLFKREYNQHKFRSGR